MKKHVVLLSVFIISSVASCANYYLPTGSMEPTILLGDQLFAATINYTPIKRSDVIIFKTPDEEKKDYIKRCVAVEGDSFEIKEGAFYLNGCRLDEPYVRGETRNDQGARFVAGSVPKGMIYVLGDNREDSFDSRHFGFVPVDNVTGKAMFISGNKIKPNREGKWIK
jgi:signal peptidase I